VAAVDAGIEQRDRYATPVESRQRHLGAAAGPRPELGTGERLGADGGRIDGSHRIDARHSRRALELGDRAGIEERRETVHGAREDVIALEPDAAARQAGEDRFLLGLGIRCPLPLVLGARLPLSRADAVSK
jgi:hypothetical protein